MADAAEPEQAVWNAICDLHRVLHGSDLRTHCGLVSVPGEFHGAWSTLSESLRNCGEIIRNPRCGQGLMAIWLRSVYERAAKVDVRTQWRLPSWECLVHHDDDNLLQLVTTDRERGYRVTKNANSGRKDLPDLFECEVSSLEQLREVAKQWSNKRRERKETGRVGEGFSEFRQFHNSPEIKRAGQLLLEAVNKCELPPAKLDEDMRERILGNLDTPESLVWRNMTGADNEDLRGLIERLSPSVAPTPSSPDDPVPPYPTPATYERDKWIYDNIEHYTCRALSTEMERQAKTRGWEPLVSRSQIKESADKYAAYHRLPQRRFRGA
jgi:hypothetical protein